MNGILNTTPKLLAGYLRQYWRDNWHGDNFPTIGDYIQNDYEDKIEFIFGIWIKYQGDPAIVEKMIQFVITQLSENPNKTKLTAKVKKLPHLPDVTTQAQIVLNKLWPCLLSEFGNGNEVKPLAPNNELTQLEKGIIEVITELKNDGEKITDDIIGAHLWDKGVYSHRTGKQYTRVHINNTKNKLIDNGYLKL